jgi:DNA-binding response OmpR family regulator
MNPVHILMVEDDINLGLLLKENFTARGYQVHLSRDGEDGWQVFRKKEFDLILLDIMMPKKDGFSLAKMIRKENIRVPIIFLTAKNFEEDKIEGFNSGCDDYITKPFSAKELQLRIDAVLKRTAPYQPTVQENKKTVLSIGKFKFDYDNRLLADGDNTRRLSTKEAELLYVLSSNMNTLLNRSAILKRVWSNDDYFTAKSMDVYLTRLRKLLKSDPAIEIQNVHGTGYRMVLKVLE